jgi:putative hemolysin
VAALSGFPTRAPRRQNVELLILIVLVLLNGLFAMSELAIVSARKVRLKASAERGDKGAATALDLLEDPARLLSTVQVGITLVGIVSGAYGATAVADDLSPLIGVIPGLAEWADDIAFGIVVLFTTYLSLVLGELVPKRIALIAPETIAVATAPLMALLANASKPLVWLLKVSTEFVLRLFRLHDTAPSEVTEEEIHAMIDEGHSAGLIEHEEREMITGVLRLGDRTVPAIMTARPAIVWLDPTAPLETTLAIVRDSGHSRYPVAVDDIDHVIGVVQTKELLVQAAGGSIDLRAAMHPPVIVPESLSVLRVLEAMHDVPVRMLLVGDEYGAIQGLVTGADLLEAIAGDVALSPDEAIAAPVARDDGSWLVDGMMPIDEFEHLIGVPGLTREGSVDTVAGFVVRALERLPTAGDKVRVPPLEFEIVDIDGRRVDKLIVRRLPAEPPHEVGPG